MNRVIRQALVLAGGHGTRMSKELNPDGCKSLIEYGGQSMLGHLIDALIDGGITNFVFATNEHSDRKVKEIVSAKKVEPSIVIVSDGKYRGVAYEVRDLLDDRFLMICGHHPVTSRHVRAMLDSAKKHRHVMSVYDNKLYGMDKHKRIIKKGDVLEYVDLNVKSIPDDHWYVRNPYVLGKEIVQAVHDDGYSQTFSYYIFRNNNHLAEAIGLVEADMPPEFDYDEEFEKMKIFLDKGRR